MLTGGIAMVSGVQGKQPQLPTASSEDQGAIAEGSFAQRMDELMAGSSKAKTSLHVQPSVTGLEKKDGFSANDQAEAGTEALESEEISTGASSLRAGATLPITRELAQAAKDTPTVIPPLSDVERVADANELKGSVAAVVESKQDSLVSRAPLVASGAIQGDADTSVSKESGSEKKVHATREHAADVKQETKREENRLPVDVAAAAANVTVSSAIAIPTATPVMAVPLRVEGMIDPKIDSGVSSTKSSRINPVGYKVSANATTGSIANRDKSLERGKDMVVDVGSSGAGVYGAGGHHPELEGSKKNASQGAAPTGAIAAASSVVAVDGSVVQGVGQKVSSGFGHEGGLRAHTADAPVARTQEEAGGEAAQVNDGHRMLSSTPTSLEVGVVNGSHGWLKIRAELTDGGTVNASVSAATSAGQEMLHRELPSLAAYLRSEGLGVNTVAVHATATATEARDFSGGVSGGEQHGQTQGGSQGGKAGQGVTGIDADRLEESTSLVRVEGSGEDALSSAVYGEGGLGGGAWLSVRA
jgi:hypothetical protein